MPEIVPLRSQHIPAVKLLIYTIAHDQYHEQPTLEESIAFYEGRGQLQDIDDFQQYYLEQGGVFLVWLEGERVIGSGALHRLQAGVGEIKRLWLLPEYHGQGLGYRMMQALLAFARRQGYGRLQLETSAREQARAYAFYRRLGFYEIPQTNGDSDDTRMELVLEEGGG